MKKIVAFASLGTALMSLSVFGLISCQGGNSTSSPDTLALDTSAPDTPATADTPASSASSTAPSGSLPAVPLDQRAIITNQKTTNQEATIPPQCYTKTDGQFNPCYTCHQLYDRQGDYRFNQLDDGALQGDYGFSDIGLHNHWQNLFVDRNAWLAEVSDGDIRAYVNKENYSKLAQKLIDSEWQGFIPDLEGYEKSAAAFDNRGLALDGSHWVAFNYKPFPGTFWPTNGSTDDVLIRLAPAFRELDGEFNANVYYINLSLAELNIKGLDSIDIWPVDENQLGIDLDNNGVLETATTINARSHYIGDALDIQIAEQQLPEGTEFMHSVRYIGLTEDNEVTVSARIKELRYMKKVAVLERETINNRFANERKEKLGGLLPYFLNVQDWGFDNGYGWYISGFIEDYNGELRPQSYEEQVFCMGCHSAIGSTIDSTFSFARKVTGSEGWKYIDLHGMKDAPSVSESEGEILSYLQRSGGGNEFRENPEMVEKWFDTDGKIKTDAVKAADVYELLTPSARRAMNLNKAYSHIVRHQSFIRGRDASWEIPDNVFHEINEETSPLDIQYRYFGWDIRLDWSRD